jgi:hypothetical protein
MDGARRTAALGFSLVSLSQLIYLQQGLRSGFGLGSTVDATSAACAAIAAYACWTGDRRRVLAGALAVFAAAQVVDYARSVGGARGGLDPFFVGFTLVVAGLVTSAIAAWRWSTTSDAMPRPLALRIGAALTALGTASYILLGLMAGFSLGPFSLGATLGAVGWALVAW